MAAPIINELLCYLANNFSCCPKDNIIKVISTFYNAKEITAAKTAIFKVASELENFEVPRLVNRKDTAKKAKLDTDDILTLYEKIDVRGCSLPIFAAAKMKRYPPFTASDADMTCLAANVIDIKAEIKSLADLKADLQCIKVLSENHEKVMNEIATIKDTISKKVDEPVKANQMSNKAQAENSTVEIQTVKPSSPVVNTGSGDVLSVSGFNNTTWAQVMSQSATDVRSWTEIKPRKLVAKGINFKSNNTTSNISAAVKITKKHVFHVDNLSNECSSEDIINFLKSCNVNVLSCFDAKSWMRESASEGSLISAFRVCIAADSKELAMDTNLWPSSVVLRDWKFKPKPKPNDG